MAGEVQRGTRERGRWLTGIGAGLTVVGVQALLTGWQIPLIGFVGAVLLTVGIATEWH